MSLNLNFQDNVKSLQASILLCIKYFLYIIQNLNWIKVFLSKFWKRQVCNLSLEGSITQNMCLVTARK